MSGDSSPPQGITRWFARLPNLLFHARLGWLLGSRFLMLTHTGRISGEPRHTTLEVVRFDPDTNTFIVASGWGEKSDWFRNIKKYPQATIHVGRELFEVYAERLPARVAEQELLDYARRNPAMIKILAGFVGHQLDGSEESLRALSSAIPLVALQVCQVDCD